MFVRFRAGMAALVVLGAAGPGWGQTALEPVDIELNAAERAELTAAQAPASDFIARLSGPRRVVDGAPLDPKIQYLLEQNARPTQSRAEVLAGFDTPQERAAARVAADRRWRVRTQVSAAMAAVEDRSVAGRHGAIPVRVYRPVTEEASLPVLVYFHGGGFVFASIEAVDRMARRMANEGRMIVVSVDYRLAPEHPYPQAHDDAEDAFVWVQQHAAALGGDPARVAVGGDSAGGNLALSTSWRAARAGRPGPAYQLLYYPAVSLGQDEASYDLFDEGYGLDRGFMEAVTELAFPDPADRRAPDVEVLAHPDLGAMPATIVVTGGFDPLRDQGRRLARRLEADGVSAVYLEYPGLTHSFLNWSAVMEEADLAARETAALLGRALRGRPAVLAMASE